ncbi:MAG TPA: hypothetical protein VL128_15595 [Candidatus Eisenbacteria bacterium]|nr:hypothetical protein [Candidatus Eisenbacteria bacterium]
MRRLSKLFFAVSPLAVSTSLIAFAAYQKSIEGKRPPDLDGFTPEQRFFLGWAQV